jgi:hypothetical protein
MTKRVELVQELEVPSNVFERYRLVFVVTEECAQIVDERPERRAHRVRAVCFELQIADDVCFGSNES